MNETYLKLVNMIQLSKLNKSTLNTTDLLALVNKLENEREFFLRVAYNAIKLGQLDEIYSEHRLCYELSCTKEEYDEIMEM